MGLQLSNEEQEYYEQLFEIADTDDIGLITRSAAQPLLDKSGLSLRTLADVLQALLQRTLTVRFGNSRIFITTDI